MTISEKKYPEWLPEELKERYDHSLKYNDPELTLLLYNPNYEEVPNCDISILKTGEQIIIGTYASTEEGNPNIRWTKYCVGDDLPPAVQILKILKKKKE